MRVSIETLEQMTEQPDGRLLVECNEADREYVRDLLRAKGFDTSPSRCGLIILDESLLDGDWSIARKTWKRRDRRF